MATPQVQGSRGNVLTGELPEGFLRLGPPPNQVAMPPGHVVPLPQPGYYANPSPFMTLQQTMGRLNVTINQAKLAKNYGLTRMDPYCRVRIGHHVFETPTAHNGSTNPRWNKVISCPLPQGVKEFYVEIFDERSFATDERIAWGFVTILDSIIEGEDLDDWYTLSGKQGDDKEGMINLILTYSKAAVPAPHNVIYGQPMPVMMVPQPMVPGAQVVYPGGYGPMRPVPIGQQQQLPQQQPQQQPRQISEQDVQTLKDMFPNMEAGAIRSVLEACAGNLDAATSHLLSMNNGQ